MNPGILLIAQAKTAVALLGHGAGITSDDVDFHFVVPCTDPMVVQETHETLYHVLWELVHVFFEHGVAG